MENPEVTMADDKLPVIVENREIQDMIYAIRGKQVMVDSDLSMLYQVQTKAFNQAVKRNIDRFPERFRFQLTEKEYENLKSQIATSSDGSKHGGRRYMPYVFTEQGIAMLSAVLRSDVAVQVSIKIMNAFVEMRRFLVSNAGIFERLNRVELKQLETDQKLEKVFNYIATQTEVKQNIVDLIKKARNKLILIDNYVDTNTLNLLCKKNQGVSVFIAGSGNGSLTSKDISKFNAQYQGLTVKTRKDFHDRFLIIDDLEVYHIGASIKDAGKKSFGISKIEDEVLKDNLIKKVK
jgi:hypothetical protein